MRNLKPTTAPTYIVSRTFVARMYHVIVAHIMDAAEEVVVLCQMTPRVRSCQLIFASD